MRNTKDTANTSLSLSHPKKRCDFFRLFFIIVDIITHLS